MNNKDDNVNCDKKYNKSIYKYKSIYSISNNENDNNNSNNEEKNNKYRQ